MIFGFQIDRAALLRGLCFGRCGNVALPLIILFATFGAMAGTTNNLSDAEIKGRELAQQYLQQKPTANAEQTGILKVRDANGKSVNIRIKSTISIATIDWTNSFEAMITSNIVDKMTLIITHFGAESNRYLYFENDKKVRVSGSGGSIQIGMGLSGARAMIPFAGSDFWFADLGLEFFHWPEQKILKHELKRSRACRVLESTNPEPSTNGYSRVLTWIDNDTGGIVQAKAYDANGKLLKEFEPKEFKKVNGQWALQEIEIRNVQTDSRTRMEFDLPDSK